MPKQGATLDRNPTLEAIRPARRRTVLRVLSSFTSGVSVEDLATMVIADELDTPLVSVTEADATSSLVSLQHQHIPALIDADLVEWDSSNECVQTTTHPAYSSPEFAHLLEVRGEEWDTIITAISHPVRRAVLVATHDEPSASASGLVDLVQPYTDEPVSPTSLQHVHLPALDDAGLIDYDRAADEVTYSGHPDLDVEWLWSGPGETPRAVTPAASRDNDVWALSGRANVLERAHSLFQQAEEEIFIMATTAGLVEESCVKQLQAAADRDVTIYFGSQTPEVRTLVSERVPEAIIWEPQHDWLNMPTERDRVGRLVFVDRESIMLATLGETLDDGTYVEKAITGNGLNNSLVVLIRELLGGRMDHLDYQSDDFLEHIVL